MVAGLFLLALVSFAAMGLFVVGLTVYSGLRGRAERADLARDALIALFSSRQSLIPELEARARELIAAHRDVAAPAPEPPAAPAGPGASHELEKWATFERTFRSFAGHVAGEWARLEPASPRLREIEHRLASTERAIGDALRAYNSAATEFNEARSFLPAVLVARVSGLGERRVLVLTQ